MDFEESLSGLANQVNSNKRSFIEALREFQSQQTVPNPKRASINANATDVIRVEISKVPIN
jgi:hypothetical protein